MQPFKDVKPEEFLPVATHSALVIKAGVGFGFYLSLAYKSIIPFFLYVFFEGKIKNQLFEKH